MRKLLWYGETPLIETGAGQVAKHLLPILQQHFEHITNVAINQWWEPKDLPQGLSIVPGTQEDLWNVANAKRLIAECSYDCLFITADVNRITDLAESIMVAHARHIPIIMYAAMDANLYNTSFYNVLDMATISVVYSEWCKRLICGMKPAYAQKMHVIGHGCEPDVFIPLSPDEKRAQRKRFFSIEDDNLFVVINVNRNQVRKDIARSMAAFHLFHEKHPESVMYVHSKQVDLGGNLPLQAACLGLRIYGERPEIIFCPEHITEAAGISRADLNCVYNAADVMITTSTGEGWGLTTTEAMAAGTPFIGPNNTVFPEILGGGERGILVESGGPNLWAMFYGHSDSPRELTSVTAMVAALEEVYNHREAAKRRAVAARLWTQDNSWEHVSFKWHEVLHAAKERQFSESHS